MMNALIRRLALSSLVLATFVGPSIVHAQACTQNLVGSYAMLVSGANVADSSSKYLTGALAFTAVNPMTGTGSVSGSNIFDSTGTTNIVSGSYIVNTDCSLNITLNVPSTSTTAQVYTVAVVNGNEAVGIEVDPSAVATIDLQAQFASVATTSSFSSSSASGLFTGVCYGPYQSTSALPVPSSDLNVTTFSSGNITGTDAYNDGGGLSIQTSGLSYSGAYTVNTDGTFTGTVLASSPAAFDYDYYGVISNSGTEIEYFYTQVQSTSQTTAFESCVAKL
jgi:hypothetical protein